MSEEKKSSFTVTDRRHFTSEGESRADAPADRPAPPPVEEVPPAPSPGDEAHPLDDSDDAPDLPGDFPGLLIFLATQATWLLGLGGPPGEAPHVDLQGARSFIGMLEALQDKTKGNRTPEEDHLLDDLLYQLRMAWVARSQRS